MYRLLILILFSTMFLIGCSSFMESETGRKEKTIENYNTRVNHVKLTYTDLEQRMESLYNNYKTLIEATTYNNITIAGDTITEETASSFTIPVPVYTLSGVNIEKNKILQTVRINGSKHHMYILVEWSVDTKEILSIERRIND